MQPSNTLRFEGKYNDPVPTLLVSTTTWRDFRSDNITGKPVDTTKFPLFRNLSLISDDSIKPRQGGT